MSKRKWINKNNFDENIQVALKYFEDVLRNDITTNPSAWNSLRELGYKIDVENIYKPYDGKFPGGSITLAWGWDDDISEIESQPRHLFRGKRLDNGEWVEGSYSKDYPQTNRHMIICPDTLSDCGGLIYYSIYPTTVGQCTGLRDISNKLIFEGDICRSTRNIGDRCRKGDIGEIYYNNFLCHFAFWNNRFGKKHGADDVYALLGAKAKHMEVIGSIWDNYPKLH